MNRNYTLSDDVKSLSSDESYAVIVPKFAKDGTTQITCNLESKNNWECSVDAPGGGFSIDVTGIYVWTHRMV